MDVDALTPLRHALAQPDRRTWRRHLRRRAAATGSPDEALRNVEVEAIDGWPTARVDEPRVIPWWAAGAAVLAIAGGIVLLAGWLPVATTPPPPPTDAALTTPAPQLGSTTEAESVPEATATTATTAERLWPPAPLEVVGRQVRTPAGRWEVGKEGDAIVVGDWNCDRRPTPAVLRPSTGLIAVFDQWAEDAPEPARPISTIEGASGIRPTGRCGELAVRTSEGSEQVVDTRPLSTP